MRLILGGALAHLSEANRSSADGLILICVCVVFKKKIHDGIRTERKMNEIMKRMSQFIKNITTGGERRGRAYKGMMSGGGNRKNSALWWL